MSELVNSHKNQHVGIISFSNGSTNFATVGLLSKLADAIFEFDRDDEIRAIVLKSEGKVFCAGADLVSPNGFGASGSDPLREFYDQVIRLFDCQKPVVAGIQGAAIGAGLGLAVFADFRIATSDARFSANFTKLGFHPGFALTYTLPRLIGPQKAAHMFLTSSRFKPEQVLSWGLVDEIVDSPDLLEANLLSFAQSIAENAPLGLKATRATLRAGIKENVINALLHEHAEQLKLQDTEDFAEGKRAVAERRVGLFTGK